MLEAAADADRRARRADDADVLQVGARGGAFARADWVLDDRPARAARRRALHPVDVDRRATSAAARRGRSPTAQFDFAVCTALTALRDPVGVCAELARVARAGYVELPDVEAELAGGDGALAVRRRRRRASSSSPSRGAAATRACACPRRRILELLAASERVHALFWEDRLPARERLVDDDELLAELAEPRPPALRALGRRGGLTEARRLGGLAAGRLRRVGGLWEGR